MGALLSAMRMQPSDAPATTTRDPVAAAGRCRCSPKTIRRPLTGVPSTLLLLLCIVAALLLCAAPSCTAPSWLVHWCRCDAIEWHSPPFAALRCAGPLLSSAAAAGRWIAPIAAAAYRCDSIRLLRRILWCRCDRCALHGDRCECWCRLPPPLCRHCSPTAAAAAVALHFVPSRVAFGWSSLSLVLRRPPFRRRRPRPPRRPPPSPPRLARSARLRRSTRSMRTCSPRLPARSELAALCSTPPTCRDSLSGPAMCASSASAPS